VARGFRALAIAAAFVFAASAEARAQHQESTGDSELWRRLSDPDADPVRLKGSRPFSFEAAAGLEYDSNVDVIDLETQTALGDFAGIFDFTAEYETKVGRRGELGFGYEFEEELRFDLTDFSSQMHVGTIDYSRKIGDLTIGAGYRLSHYRLGGDGFLRINRIRPFAAIRAFSGKAMFRASYFFKDKRFIERPDRSSEVHAVGADVFYYLNGRKTYLIAGYRFETEDAAAPQFDFDSHHVSLRFLQRIPLNRRSVRLQIGWRYEDRDYKSVTPSIGIVRDDSRNRVNASLEAPLGERFFAEAEFQRDFFDSNLPAADFDQSVTSLRLGARY
jgi:hypothetical protein